MGSSKVFGCLLTLGGDGYGWALFCLIMLRFFSHATTKINLTKYLISPNYLSYYLKIYLSSPRNYYFHSFSYQLSLVDTVMNSLT